MSKEQAVGELLLTIVRSLKESGDGPVRESADRYLRLLERDLKRINRQENRNRSVESHQFSKVNTTITINLQ